MSICGGFPRFGSGFRFLPLAASLTAPVSTMIPHPDHKMLTLEAGRGMPPARALAGAALALALALGQKPDHPHADRADQDDKPGLVNAENLVAARLAPGLGRWRPGPGASH